MASNFDDEAVKSSSEETFQKECSPCELDGIVKEAKNFCTECQEYLCQPCESLHKRFKGTRNHTVSLCADVKSEHREDDVDAVMCCCKRKDVEIYCENHNQVVCSDCKMINHRHCTTNSIDTVILEQDEDLDINTLEFSEEVKKATEQLVQGRKESLHQLNADRDQAKEEIILFGNELKNQIEILQEKSLADLKTYSCRLNDVIQDHLTACETALRTLSFDYNKYLATKETPNKLKKFLTHIDLTQTLKAVHDLTDNIQQEIYEPALRFDKNEDLSTVLGFDYLGSVKHNLRNLPRSFNADLAVKSAREVTVKLPSDQSDTWISSSIFLPSGELILCDKNNNCFKHFDAEFISGKCHPLPRCPRDCCLVNQNEILVTFPELKQIQHYNTSPNICLKNTIKFYTQCECVASLKDDIFVTCSTVKEIRVIDINGNLKRTLTLKEDVSGELLCPYYIAVSALGQIYISESNYVANKTQIRCFDNFGVCRYKMARQDLDGTGGLLVDDEGCLLACFSKSNAVQVISKDGLNSRKFFDVNDESRMNAPYSASFRKSDATLVIAQRDKNQMFIFKMIYK